MIKLKLFRQKDNTEIQNRFDELDRYKIVETKIMKELIRYDRGSDKNLIVAICNCGSIVDQGKDINCRDCGKTIVWEI